MREILVFALGDSITYGFPYGPERSWVKLVSQRLGVNIINGGINGDTTSFMLRRLPQALQGSPTHLLLLGGTNDAYWGAPPGLVAENIMAAGKMARERGASFVLGLPIPVDEPRVEALLAEYRALMLDLASCRGYPTIPFHRAFLDEGGRFRVELTTDGCHPNIDGYEAMAEAAEEVLPGILGIR